MMTSKLAQDFGKQYMYKRDIDWQLVEKADADFVRESTGFAIGGVAPLGHKNKPIYYLDSKLVEFDEVWCAAGTPSSLFKLKTEDLLNVTDA